MTKGQHMPALYPLTFAVQDNRRQFVPHAYERGPVQHLEITIRQRAVRLSDVE
jgi:hypothetical protein